MFRKLKIGLLLGAAILMLSGCYMTTVDELYCLPKRSEAYTNLQSVMNQAAAGLEYSAPVSGENRQIVQMADLDGDGEEEIILFAKNTSENPLQILIFSSRNGEYYLADTIESSGSAFDQVEYVRLNDRSGFEMVVGRQVSDQVIRSLSVYSMVGGQMEQLMRVSYTEFLCTDLDRSGRQELFILRPGEKEGGNGVAELYSLKDGTVERSNEVDMSRPADKIKRLMVGRLNDGVSAIYVASDADNDAIITDVYAVVDNELSNVSLSSESGTSVQTLRNYYVYADDIDNDGVLELPSLVNVYAPTNSAIAQDQYVIRWYALNADGTSVDKLYTYHNFVGGWYLELSGDIAPRFSVQQMGNSYEFGLWNEEMLELEKILSVHVLTGQKREEQALADNRFVLYRGENTIYAAKLEVASAAYGLNKENLISGFHLIVRDWNTWET